MDSTFDDMVAEEFWGCTLSAQKRSITVNDEDQKISISRACLGAGAKAGERSIVSVTVDEETHALVSLSVEQLEFVTLDAQFAEKVTFKLDGPGPVSLTGKREYLDEDTDDSEDDDEITPKLVPLDEEPKKAESKMDDKDEGTKKEDAVSAGISKQAEKRKLEEVPTVMNSGKKPKSEEAVATKVSVDMKSAVNIPKNAVGLENGEPEIDGSEAPPADDVDIIDDEAVEESEEEDSDEGEEIDGDDVESEDEINGDDDDSMDEDEDDSGEEEKSEEEVQPIKKEKKMNNKPTKSQDNAKKQSLVKDEKIPAMDTDNKKNGDNKNNKGKKDLTKTPVQNKLTGKSIKGNKIEVPTVVNGSKKEQSEEEKVVAAEVKNGSESSSAEDGDIIDNEAVEESEEEDSEEGEEVDGDDVDSEDESEDEDDNMVDSEDDSDEEDESDEEMQPVKKEKKVHNKPTKPQSNTKKQPPVKGEKIPAKNTDSKKDSNNSSKGKKDLTKTPVQNKLAGKNIKGNKNEKTPASKTPGQGGPKKDVVELKTILAKSPNLPKKKEKFTNFLKNNYKVTDGKQIADLWTFVEDQRK